MDIEKQSNLVDARIAGWMARYGILLTRIALGIVFFWFGVLKFFPGLSVAEDISSRTISALTFGLVPPALSVPVLAAWECLIGMGLILGKFLRLTLLLLFLQMPGTFLPLVLFPSETWWRFRTCHRWKGNTSSRIACSWARPFWWAQPSAAEA